MKLFYVIVTLCALECSYGLPKDIIECPPQDVYAAERNSKVIVAATVDRIMNDHSVTVAIRRVLKGSQDLTGSIMIVIGLDDCDTLHLNDIRYFLLNSVRPGVMSASAVPLRITLDNIELLNAALAGVAVRRSGYSPELPCETKYCPNNQDCHEHNGHATCRCLDSCPYDAQATPVCANDRRNYTSHCRLRVDTCRRSQKVWVTWAGTCDNPIDKQLHPFEINFQTY